jgi:hypothetical protein
MATIPEDIKKVFDSTYVKIDTIEELQKLIDTNEAQLFNKVYAPITITKETRVDTKRGFFKGEQDVETNVYKISSEPSNKSFAISSLLRFGVFRKPILTALAAAPTEYPAATSGSLYLGASEADAMKEQAAVLDVDVLKKLAYLRNSKTIFLYAKDVKKNTYSKVSISKDATPTTIYLNPIKPTNRAAEEKRIKDELQSQIDTLKADLASVNGETDASLQTCATISNEGAIIPVTPAALQKNKDKVVKRIQAEINTHTSNLTTNFANYIKRALTYGQQIGLDKLKTKYLLVISTKPWVEETIPVVEPNTTAVANAVAPVNETRGAVVPDATAEQQAREPTPTGPPGNIFSNFAGFLRGKTGGSRKTKKSNKKSLKQKSKKQAKSRKLFKGFLY